MVFSCYSSCGGSGGETLEDSYYFNKTTAETATNSTASSEDELVVVEEEEKIVDNDRLITNNNNISTIPPSSVPKERNHPGRQQISSSMRGADSCVALRVSTSRRSGTGRLVSPTHPRSRSTERWKEKHSPHQEAPSENEGGVEHGGGGKHKAESSTSSSSASLHLVNGFKHLSVAPSPHHAESQKTSPSQMHARAMSDPFDTQEDVHSDVEAYHHEEHRRRQQQQQFDQDGPVVLPSLPRYPVADTRNLNCWNEPPVSLFQVRGPRYFQDKVKVTSAPYLFAARGCDLFLSDEKNHVEAENRTHVILEGRLRREPTLFINFRFPWGFMIFYYQVPEKLVPYMTNTPIPIDRKLSVQEKVAAAWLQGSTEYRNERLKLIPIITEGPWVVRNMVGGRPAIIGKRLPVKYTLQESGDPQSHMAPFLCATLDIGSSSAAAKRIVSVCRRYMSSLTVDIGFCIQSESPEELPEQMLGSIRVHGPDPLRALHLC